MSARVEVAEAAGTCAGVERALTLTADAAARARAAGSVACTLGPVIHNPPVVAELEAAGTVAVSALEEVPKGATLVLRAHGVTASVEDAAHACGLAVTDATCPLVKRVHEIARARAEEGYEVCVVGEERHPEVVATCERAGGARVIADGVEAEAVADALGPRVALVAQTTLEPRVLAEVARALTPHVRTLVVENTICKATSARQQAAAELARRADVIVVLGGRSSANTCHLADVCRSQGTPTHHVEHPQELEASWFSGAGLIGVTAGASTPASQIEELTRAIEALL